LGIKNTKKGDGVFLVRLTSRVECYAILSLMHRSEFYNYEIVAKSNDTLFYIDDGPYFNSLELLIEHYMKYEDGLPGRLVSPVEPDKKVKPVSTAEKMAKLNVVDDKQAGTQPLFRKTSSGFTREDANRNAVLEASKNVARVKNNSRKEIVIIDLSEIKIGEKLGQGEFGEVFKGTYNSVISNLKIRRITDYVLRSF
jgi:tyrosine-protein kinase